MFAVHYSLQNSYFFGPIFRSSWSSQKVSVGLWLYSLFWAFTCFLSSFGTATLLVIMTLKKCLRQQWGLSEAGEKLQCPEVLHERTCQMTCLITAFSHITQTKKEKENQILELTHSSCSTFTSASWKGVLFFLMQIKNNNNKSIK